MKNIFLTVLVLLGTTHFILAQASNRALYATQFVQQKIFKEHPEYIESTEALNKFALNFKPSNKDLVKKEAIPVVFHILHHAEQPILDQRIIEEQLAVLNEAFNSEKAKSEFKHKADILEGFSKRVAKMELSFCAPQSAPNGSKKFGYIQYVEVDSLQWTASNNMKSEKTGGVSPWDPERYLNIWVVHLSPNLRGFAQMPNAGPKATDGIVINQAFFGTNKENPSSYNQGKTLVHLVGSYLGLYELWNEYKRCEDDYVFDTPIHNAPSFHCFGYKYVSTCDGNEVAMTMNYMDTSPDECLRMFTKGQRYRLHAMLSENGPRAGLLATKTQCNGNLKNIATAPTLQLEHLTSTELADDRVSIFPNPAKSSFTVDWQLNQIGPVSILISNIHNQRIAFQQQLDPVAGRLEFQSSTWPAGVYLVTLLQDQRIVSTQRIIINQ